MCTRCGIHYVSPNLEYQLNEDEESCSVSGIGTCTDTALVIPVVYNDKPVTAIADSAFRGQTSLTSITIPQGVTSIGSSAFEYCSGLTSITFQGTKAQWNAISKGSDWNANTGNYTIHCTDEDISK